MNIETFIHLWTINQAPTRCGNISRSVVSHSHPTPTLHSYSDAIGRIARVSNEKEVALIAYYGKSEHLTHVKQATSHLTQVFVDLKNDNGWVTTKFERASSRGVSDISTHKSDQQRNKERVNAQIEIAKKRVQKALNEVGSLSRLNTQRAIYCVDEVLFEANNHDNIIEVFGSKRKKMALTEDQVLAKYEGLKDTFKKGKDKDKKARSKELKIEARKIKEWEAGTLKEFPHSSATWQANRVWIRVKLGDNGKPWVQTSKGITFGVKGSRKIWDLVEQVKTGAIETKDVRGKSIGKWTISEVSRNGDLRITCHRFEYADLERIALELGFMSS